MIYYLYIYIIESCIFNVFNIDTLGFHKPTSEPRQPTNQERVLRVTVGAEHAQ